jgi:1-acyl-sn-glycerol-3-phosphate acyltransferase
MASPVSFLPEPRPTFPRGEGVIFGGVRDVPSICERYERRWLTRVAMGVNRMYTRVYHQVHLQSRCTLPRRGAAILVSNHISGLDPLLLQSACPRLIRWMMAREYYEIPGLRRRLDAIGAIPVQRNGRDLPATRAALEALEQGCVVGVFPEGRIATTHRLPPFQLGIGLLAIKSGVKVYPACISGSPLGTEMAEAFCLPQTARLAFGGPVDFADMEPAGKPSAVYGRATARIEAAVRELMERCEKQGGNRASRGEQP